MTSDDEEKKKSGDSGSGWSTADEGVSSEDEYAVKTKKDKELEIRERILLNMKNNVGKTKKKKKKKKKKKVDENEMESDKNGEITDKSDNEKAEKKRKGRSSSREQIKRERSKSNEQRRSKSKDRARSKSKDRARSKSKDRKRSRSKDKRSRSRDKRSRSRDKRSPLRTNRSRSRERRSPPRDSRSRVRRSPSRDRRRPRSIAADRKRRSRSRKRSVSRSPKRRSRSPDRRVGGRWARSRSRTRKSSPKRSPTRTSNRTSPSNGSSSKADSKDVADTNIRAATAQPGKIGMPNLKTLTNLLEKNVTKKADIKKPYGAWEEVPKVNADIDKFTKLCAQISAKEGQVEEVGADKEQAAEASVNTAVHHPFVNTPAPIHITPHLGSSWHATTPAQAIMQGTLGGRLAITYSGGFDALQLQGPAEKSFPVSSGQEHAMHERSGTNMEEPVYKPPDETMKPVDVSGLIARRLGAQQILTANPNDTTAQQVLQTCDVKLKQWSEQKKHKNPGKFTGEASGLTKMMEREISGAVDAWVRKDFFFNLQPLKDTNLGMTMMRRMGWREGTPLGKTGEGYVEPIPVSVKVGRGGLTSQDEVQVLNSHAQAMVANNKRARNVAPIVDVNGKHPVSALTELAFKRRMGVAEYKVVFEAGSNMNKNFLMKVTLNGVDYQSSVASPNKKHAKAQAAITALRVLGVIQ